MKSLKASQEARPEHLINWYPGHMARAMRRIGDYLSSIDIVVEVVDARIARSGRNPALGALIGRRAHIVVLDRDDLADANVTQAWIAALQGAARSVIAVDGRKARSVARIGTAIRRVAQGRRGVSRAIVVGIPNSGKSSIINALLRRTAAKTENRAGVTRALQWFRLAPNVELMDTPGILVPKIASDDAQWKLAVCGAVPRERYDPEGIARAFGHWVSARSLRMDVPELDGFAASRGFVRRGGQIDYHNAAQSYVRALSGGEFGRFSFEAPDDAEAA
jgi:ribosome biogenesis GTPase A